tara:strand:- start:206 stop:472 length:267 start_codon:yes stop_codon:yes gene_type:complete
MKTVINLTTGTQEQLELTEQDLKDNAEHEKVWAVHRADFAKTQYTIDRKAEYPPIEDYLDGIVKGDTAQVEKYIADCQAVKDAHPKPE